MLSQNSNNILEKAQEWLQLELPFVVYRKPHETLLRAVFQNDSSVKNSTDFQEPGFVIAPFSKTESAILLTGDYVESNWEPQSFQFKTAHNATPHRGKEDYHKLLEKAITTIKQSPLKKVVLSRKHSTRTNKSEVAIFSSLLEKYATAFCYWWYHPKIGMWFGATPELLLQAHNTQIFTTSLAGTLPVQGDKPPTWSSKELEEQKMVTDYIENTIQAEMAELKISDTTSHKAGTLWHLRTELQGNVTNQSRLPKVVEKLHPTPAVCGLPMKDGIAFIKANEGYDREFYTGYLGPVHLEDKDQISLFVNLRCFKKIGAEAVLFVGGGITASSDPESEWQETIFKSKTILDVL